MKNLLVFFLLLSLSISACKKDDGDDMDDLCQQDGTFTCLVDGVPFTGVTFNNTLLKLTDQGFDVKRLDIRATNANGDQLILTSNEFRDGHQGNCVRLDSFYFDIAAALEDSVDNCIGISCVIALGTYTESGSTAALATLYSSPGALNITSCSENDLLISGTFSFVAENLGSGQTITVTQGQFADQCYTVLD